MTPSQILIIVLLLGLLTAFATDRFRADTIAIGGLVAGILLGLVPLDRIFSGLTNPAVLTVVEVLLIVQALSRSHAFDRIGEWLNRRFVRPHALVMALCGFAACLSSVMNNVAAFSLMLPACFSVIAKGRVSARWIFLPLSYATLLGGLWTSIGTPPNLIASSFLQQSGTRGFSLLDFAPVGIAATAVCLLVMALWLPRTLFDEGDEQAPEDPVSIHRSMTELVFSSAGQAPSSVGLVEHLLEGRVCNILRDERRLFPLKNETAVLPGDRLLVEADPKNLEKALAAGIVSYGRRGGGADRRRVKAIVMPHSLLAGSSIAAQDPVNERAVEILQVEGEPARFEGPFEELSFRVGSILLLEGDDAAIRSFISYHDLVEVAGDPQTDLSAVGVLPLAVFALGVLAAASGLAPPEIALAGVVAVLCLIGRLDIRAALRNLNWPIIIILVAMLPLGEAVGTTGAAAAIATAVTGYLPLSMAPLAVFVLLAIAMAITPFVNNATTVVILAPIAVEIASATQLSPQMLVMAVAVGASCDFLTPFGHHNNMLAYSLGHYRFRDVLKLGWPVSLAAFLTAGTVLLLYW